MEATDAKRHRGLEGENANRKELLSEAPLDIHVLEEVFRVKRPPHKSSTRPLARGSSRLIPPNVTQARLVGGRQR